VKIWIHNVPKHSYLSLLGSRHYLLWSVADPIGGEATWMLVGLPPKDAAPEHGANILKLVFDGQCDPGLMFHVCTQNAVECCLGQNGMLRFWQNSKQTKTSTGYLSTLKVQTGLREVPSPELHFPPGK